MTLAIDSSTYRKDTRYDPGHGWGSYDAATDRYIRRERRPSSLVIHTTNGRVGSSFAGEATFLRDSQDVSCGYLVGKAGQIALILPDTLEGWHAGRAVPAFTNAASIGIECHLGVLGNRGQVLPEQQWEKWTEAQRTALAELCRQLMIRWSIPTTRVETHRKIATPVGRKVDPSNWSDKDFYVWRDALRLDPWAAWGAKGFPIAEHEKAWAPAQAWLKNSAQLGAALSGHVYPDSRWLYILFERGVISQWLGHLPVVESD